ncbi:hypothetical protein EAS54_38530 [Bradyrhizobium guangzhouense]|nr:hypothetical protein EAS54_38530 [Bradyrhizobium guangzhouense]
MTKPADAPDTASRSRGDANELWAASPVDAVANVVGPDPTRLLAFGKEASRDDRPFEIATSIAAAEAKQPDEILRRISLACLVL